MIRKVTKFITIDGKEHETELEAQLYSIEMIRCVVLERLNKVEGLDRYFARDISLVLIPDNPDAVDVFVNRLANVVNFS